MKTIKKLPMLGFGEAVKLASGRLFDFKGRSRRSEYWWWALATGIAGFICSLLFAFIPILQFVASVLISFCTLAATVRRVHDTGHSGIWAWIVFICTVVWLGILAYLGEEIGGMSNDDIDMTTFGIIGLFVLVMFIISIVVFIFTVLDSKPDPNKYGDSPKYIVEDDAQTTSPEDAEIVREV